MVMWWVGTCVKKIHPYTETRLDTLRAASSRQQHQYEQGHTLTPPHAPILLVLLTELSFAWFKY